MNLDDLMANIDEALRTYRCQHHTDDDGNGLDLVDALTPDCAPDIALGKDELRLLADHIYGVLFDAGVR